MTAEEQLAAASTPCASCRRAAAVLRLDELMHTACAAAISRARTTAEAAPQ